jgi:hypothetical protein
MSTKNLRAATRSTEETSVAQRSSFVAALAGVCIALTGCGGDSSSSSRTASLQTLSNRADLVSGDSVLVEVKLPDAASTGQLRIDRDGTDMTPAFVTLADGRIVGLVTGLKPGANVIKAQAADASFGGASLTVTDHPIGGPVLLGSQIEPWVCATPAPVAQSGDTPGSNASGLSTAATDAQCNIATEKKLFYRTTTAGCSMSLPDPSPGQPAASNNCFKPYDPSATAPGDLATTTTSDGVTVPYIVQVERGTINRGIYDVAVLFDPTKPWTPTTPQRQWNRKVVYSFGASTGQPRLQYRSEQNWADDAALSRGFMVVDNSLTDSLYDSNRVLNAETLMMMKEHVIDHYGEIKYLMGNGCSGGSIQQNTALSIYPGLLDGIQPSCDYPDSDTTAIEVSDCGLLVHAYNTAPWQALMTGSTQEQINAKKAAINGHPDQSGCQGWTNLFFNADRPGNYTPYLVTDAATGAAGFVGTPRNNCLLPASMVYDPASNPNGIRCGSKEAAVAVFGTKADSNVGRYTNDNVGVQYGLKALKSGAITPEEFVALNEQIGGVDADGNFVAQRTVADPTGLLIAYQSGVVADGRKLATAAIIDQRGWDNSNIITLPGGGTSPYAIHHTWRSFSERDRLDQDAGSHANQVLWRFPTGLVPPPALQLPLQSMLTMDQWLSRLSTDVPKATVNDARTQAQVVAAKPAAAADFCALSTDPTFSVKVTDAAACDQDPFLAPDASPRQVAGGPRTENILKCQLKPVDLNDYLPATLSPALQTRLQNIFPGGVCDWSKPGVGQQPAATPRTYQAGPGGVPLPAAPVSTPI